MRTAILILVLAVSQAVNQTTTGFDQQQQQVGGCKLRCRKLTFIGEGSVPIKPNWALIELSVDVSSLQLQAGGNNDMMSNTSGGNGGNSSEMQAAMKVRQEALHRSQFILNYLKDLKTEQIQDLQTQEISFRPEYNFDNNGDRKFVGYKATFGLSFKVLLDKMQDVLDHIVSDSGANRVDSIVFIADKQVEQQAAIKAMELATSSAWQQAQAVAKVLGIQGNLKLLSVRDKILPAKKLLRRFARRFEGEGMGMGRGMGEGDMGDMGDNDSDFTGMLGNWIHGDQIIHALLVFQFDFEDGTINFHEVAPLTNNMTIADEFGPLLRGQNNTQTAGQQQTTNQPQAINQPIATNATVVLPPNNTAAMKPGVTQPVVQPTNPP